MCIRDRLIATGGRIYRRPYLRTAVYTAVRVCGRPYIPPSVSVDGRIYPPLFIATGGRIYRRPYLRAAVYTAVRICGRPCTPPSVSADGRIYRRPYLRTAVYTAVRICGRPYIPPSVSIWIHNIWDPRSTEKVNFLNYFAFRYILYIVETEPPARIFLVKINTFSGDNIFTRKKYLFAPGK